MNYIIGVGGVGSWLAHTMVRLVGPDEVTLVDGDNLEQKNLDRQLFSEDQIGKNKAEALSEKLGCLGVPGWFTPYTITPNQGDWLLCCVDNNPGRMSVLTACDNTGALAICAANETHSSEAYVYDPMWRDTDLDPRKYYPEIAADQTNDPVRASAGCTGEAQVKNRQLVTANLMAASLAAHLYVVWAMERQKLSAEVWPHLPVRLFQNLSRNGFVKQGQ